MCKAPRPSSKHRADNLSEPALREHLTDTYLLDLVQADVISSSVIGLCGSGAAVVYHSIGILERNAVATTRSPHQGCRLHHSESDEKHVERTHDVVAARRNRDNLQLQFSSRNSCNELR